MQTFEQWFSAFICTRDPTSLSISLRGKRQELSQQRNKEVCLLIINSSNKYREDVLIEIAIRWDVSSATAHEYLNQAENTLKLWNPSWKSNYLPTKSDAIIRRLSNYHRGWQNSIDRLREQAKELELEIQKKRQLLFELEKQLQALPLNHAKKIYELQEAERCLSVVKGEICEEMKDRNFLKMKCPNRDCSCFNHCQTIMRKKLKEIQRMEEAHRSGKICSLCGKPLGKESPAIWGNFPNQKYFFDTDECKERFHKFGLDKKVM